MRRVKGIYSLFNDCEAYCNRFEEEMQPIHKFNNKKNEEVVISKPKKVVNAQSSETSFCDYGSPISLSFSHEVFDDIATDNHEYADQQSYADDLDYYVEPFENNPEKDKPSGKQKQPVGDDFNKKILDDQQPVDIPPIIKDQVPQRPDLMQPKPTPLPVQPEPPQRMPVMPDDAKEIPMKDQQFDFQEIMKKKKDYESFQEKVDPNAANEKKRQQNVSKAKSFDDPYYTGEHNIFEKIAQNMSLANSYDLGSISLEQRFDSFEKDMEDKEESVQAVGRKKVAAPKLMKNAPPKKKKQNTKGKPDANVAKKNFIGTDDFLEDLDVMTFSKTYEGENPNTSITKNEGNYYEEEQSEFSHEAAINFPTPRVIFEKYKEIYKKFPNNKVTNWAENECAVRLSWALSQLGVDIKGSGEYRDIYNSERSGPVQPSARALAKWLVKRLGKPQYLNKLPSKYQQSDFNGKEGIIYFVHQEKHGGNGPGHIDVIYNNDIGSRFYPNGKLWFWEYNNGW